MSHGSPALGHIYINDLEEKVGDMISEFTVHPIGGTVGSDEGYNGS